MKKADDKDYLIPKIVQFECSWSRNEITQLPPHVQNFEHVAGYIKISFFNMKTNVFRVFRIIRIALKGVKLLEKDSASLLSFICPTPSMIIFKLTKIQISTSFLF